MNEEQKKKQKETTYRYRDTNAPTHWNPIKTHKNPTKLKVIIYTKDL